jgi:site-specific recombinase XerD
MDEPATGQLIRLIRKSELAQDIQGLIIDRQARGLSPRTIEFYSDELRHWQRWPEQQGIDSVRVIGSSEVRHYLVALGKQRNPGGVHAAYRAVRAFLNWFGDEYEPDVWANPIAKVRPPKVRREPLEPVPLPDVKKMLATCKRRTFLGDRDRAILLALLDTGCRANEFLSLDVSDLNLHMGAVVVQRGKGNRTRVVFLGSKARRALARYLRHRKDRTGPLWVTVHGGRMRYHGLRSMLRNRARKVAVDAPGPHAFRRAFCLAMLRNGADLLTISRLMGHADVSLIARYAQQLREDLRQVHAQAGPVDTFL